MDRKFRMEDNKGDADLVLQTIARHLNCLAEKDRNTRKRAIEGLRKETIGRKPAIDPSALKEVLREIVIPILKLLSDPVEKCRELSITLLSDSLSVVPEPSDFLSYILPVMVQRLGQKEIVEQSEELRLQLVEMLTKLVDWSRKKNAPYLDDIVKILQRTIVDPYPEVRKGSCLCARSVAKAIPEYFHMQSESLIKPLLQTISHQHSRIRTEVVLAIGDVIQYGDGKSVDEVVSHLAQRLFDQAPSVRAAVIQVVGGWLLDLADRYSFHHKLIPLLLTGITDEMPDIQTQAQALWHDVGLKYEGENENDLKDKQDFVKPDSDHYPAGIERPNLGCRTLVYRHFSKVVSGLVRDLTDWVVATRIKSAQLLYVLLLNEEDNVTQHLPKVIDGLYKASVDCEQEVVTYVRKSSELIGYFVHPEVWCKMVLETVKSSQSVGSLLVLGNVLHGTPKASLQSCIHDVCNVLSDPHVCRIAESSVQTQLLVCVDSIVAVDQTDCQAVGLPLFTVIITVLALHRSDAIRDECHRLLSDLTAAHELNSPQALYELYTKATVRALQEDYTHWTQHSVERLVFDTLLLEAGPVIGELLDDIIPVLVTNLHPEKDAEVRLKFFALLSRLMMNSAHTLDSRQRFGEFAVSVARDMIVPNCVWRAGRTAGAIRTTAVSCLWALLQSGVLNKERLLEVVEELLTQLRSTLEDDNHSTRLVSCRVMTRIFVTAGAGLDQDRLHNMYPDLLKRLDDSSDDIRVAMCTTFLAYLDCFGDAYEVDLYRAHLEAMYRGLLVHMDDPDTKIQEAVLEVLKKAGQLHPAMLLQEIDDVQHKHRSTSYCQKLQQYLHSLPKPV